MRIVGLDMHRMVAEAVMLDDGRVARLGRVGVAATWRDRRGRVARWPNLFETMRQRTTRVVLAAAHLDSDPTNNRLANLRSLCQRCHMLHDRPHYLAQRWITYRRRYTLGDLFMGFYDVGVCWNGLPPGRTRPCGCPS